MDAGVRGKELTPFLLNELATLTEGKSLRANQTLVVQNARLAAQNQCPAPDIDFSFEWRSVRGANRRPEPPARGEPGSRKVRT